MSASSVKVAIVGLGFGAEFIPIYQKGDNGDRHDFELFGCVEFPARSPVLGCRCASQPKERFGWSD